MVTHWSNHTKYWGKAKRLVKRGDKRGKKALDLFLNKYAHNSLGNPLEEDANQLWITVFRTFEQK